MVRHWVPVKARGNQQGVSFESKEHSMTPCRQRNLPGETEREKCALKSKACFPPLWSLFSLELKLSLSNSQILLAYQKISMPYPSFIFILVQSFISSISRMTTYIWKTCSCTPFHCFMSLPPLSWDKRVIFIIIIIKCLTNTKVMELFIEMCSSHVISK